MIRVIIADDHPVVIQGIRDVLDKNNLFEVTATFRDGKTLLQFPALSRADILLLDLNMPHRDGLEVLDELPRLAPQLKVLVITSYQSEQLAGKCREKGVSGYLVKTDDLHQLESVIQAIVSGQTVYPDFSEALQEKENKFSYFDEFMKKYKLTKREVEIIRLICGNLSSSAIADKLFVSSFTVQTHRRNILRKLELEGPNSRIALYKFASENGML